MTADLAELHDELRAVARDLLGKATPLVGDGGPPPPLDWSQLAEMGWLGLEVPEALGGAGATFAEVALILEEMGRATAVGPVLGTLALGVGALGLVEVGAGRDALLGGIAAGRVRIATVLADGSPHVDPGASFALRTGTPGWRLDGRAELVVDVPDADQLLVLARDPDGRSVLALVDPKDQGVLVSPQLLVDATRTAASVEADGVSVAEDAVLRFAGDADEAVRRLVARAAVAVACDSLGVSRAMLDATVAYAKVREQFGRPIGSFQAVKHQCADLLVAISVSEELLRIAVDDLARDDPAASVSASMAKSFVTECGVEVAGTAMQLHGGIGYAWESGVHVYLKRATLDRTLFGSPAEHRRRLGERLLARALPEPG